MKRLSSYVVPAAGAVLFLLLSSCASPRGAYKAGFDFSGIRTVRVGHFTPAAEGSNSGDVVAGEFMRQLLAAGYSVKTTDGDADVVLEGNVTEYQPNRRYLLQSGERRAGRRQVVVQEPVELGGTGAYSYGTSFGLGKDSRVVVSNATIGVSAFMKDPRTGEIVWSNSFTYEGLDLDTALEGTVRTLVRSWVQNKNR